MTIEEAIQHFGNQSKLARALNIHRQSITQWIKQGCVPTAHQLTLQHLTGGRLKAGLEGMKKFEELKVKWPKVVHNNGETLIAWIDLCNGTMFRITAFYTTSSAPKRALYVGIERIGSFFFDLDTPKSAGYVSEKLTVNSVDAAVIADWINAQLEKEFPQQGEYFINYLNEVEPYSLGCEKKTMPLIPEVIK